MRTEAAMRVCGHGCMLVCAYACRSVCVLARAPVEARTRRGHVHTRRDARVSACAIAFVSSCDRAHARALVHACAGGSVIRGTRAHAGYRHPPILCSSCAYGSVCMRDGVSGLCTCMHACMHARHACLHACLVMSGHATSCRGARAHVCVRLQVHTCIYAATRMRT